jgi:hypothetical protein
MTGHFLLPSHITIESQKDHEGFKVRRGSGFGCWVLGFGRGCSDSGSGSGAVVLNF